MRVVGFLSHTLGLACSWRGLLAVALLVVLACGSVLSAGADAPGAYGVRLVGPYSVDYTDVGTGPYSVQLRTLAPGDVVLGWWLEQSTCVAFDYGEIRVGAVEALVSGNSWFSEYTCDTLTVGASDASEASALGSNPNQTWAPLRFPSGGAIWVAQPEAGPETQGHMDFYFEIASACPDSQGCGNGSGGVSPTPTLAAFAGFTAAQGAELISVVNDLSLLTFLMSAFIAGLFMVGIVGFLRR